jgi:hypothetical protein
LGLSVLVRRSSSVIGIRFESPKVTVFNSPRWIIRVMVRFDTDNATAASEYVTAIVSTI